MMFQEISKIDDPEINGELTLDIEQPGNFLSMSMFEKNNPEKGQHIIYDEDLKGLYGFYKRWLTKKEIRTFHISNKKATSNEVLVIGDYLIKNKHLIRVSRYKSSNSFTNKEYKINDMFFDINQFGDFLEKYLNKEETL